MRHKTIVLVMNWVPMARHGLILRENEATGSRKVAKYLLGLRDAISMPKNVSKAKQPNIMMFPRIYLSE